MARVKTYRYRRPGGTVVAVQWTGENTAEIAEFCERHEFTNDCLKICWGDHYVTLVPVGHFIYRGSHGGLTSLPPAEFAARFEENIPSFAVGDRVMTATSSPFTENRTGEIAEVLGDGLYSFNDRGLRLVMHASELVLA